MHHCVPEICTYVHISVTKWCIVGHRLMHFGICGLRPSCMSRKSYIAPNQTPTLDYKMIKKMTSLRTNPASIATLAQRWPNVNPYVGPTSVHQRWANVDLSIGPTLAQRLHANVGPTLCQHRPNVGTLTLGQRWHNVMPMVVCQRCTNIGPTEAALLAFCEGNPSVTDRSPVEQTVELSNQWFETPMWSTSM